MQPFFPQYQEPQIQAQPMSRLDELNQLHKAHMAENKLKDSKIRAAIAEEKVREAQSKLDEMYMTDQGTIEEMSPEKAALIERLIMEARAE